MKIVILGAGSVGLLITKSLYEMHEVIVIDKNAQKLSAISDSYDVMTIHGNAMSLETLQASGLADAEIFIAATNNDEINMVAVKLAHEMFSVPRKIVRISNREFIENKDRIFNENCIPADYVIDTDKIITDAIFNIINYAGISRIDTFIDDTIAIFQLQVQYGGQLVGERIESFYENINLDVVKIIAMYRNDLYIPVNNHTIIESGDQIIVLCQKQHIKTVMSFFQRLERKAKKIIIAGGGRIGARLASELSNQFGAQIKLIEINNQKSHDISNLLANCLVINGDATDEDLLFRERIDSTDLLIGCSHDDNTNLLSCLLAKKLGAKKVISLIEKVSYHMLTKQTDIDIVFSSHYVLSYLLQSKVRHGIVTKTVFGGLNSSEILELLVVGDEKSSNLINRNLGDINFPHSTIICAIFRKNKYMEVTNNFVIQKNDKFICYVMTKKDSYDLEKMFSVSNKFI